MRVGLRGESLDQVDARLSAAVERDFVTVFGVKPRSFFAARRQRVAQAYLQLDSPTTMARQHGRAGALAGLDVLLLAVAIHIHWRKGTAR